MAFVPLASYLEKIEKALEDLRKKGVIQSYRRTRKGNHSPSFFFHLTIPYLSRGVLVEFIIGSSYSDIKNSSGFFQVELPRFHELVETSHIKRTLLKEIRSRIKGVESEEIVAHVLSFLEKERIIHSYYRANGRKDMEGEDFGITFFDDEFNFIKMPLQVKSSEKGQMKHIQMYPHVPSICIKDIKDNDCVADVCQRIVKIIDSFKNGKVSHL